eukprot:7771163-Pyramimonas_sp.AAC.1
MKGGKYDRDAPTDAAASISVTKARTHSKITCHCAQERDKLTMILVDILEGEDRLRQTELDEALALQICFLSSSLQERPGVPGGKAKRTRR